MTLVSPVSREGFPTRRSLRVGFDDWNDLSDKRKSLLGDHAPRFLLIHHLSGPPMSMERREGGVTGVEFGTSYLKCRRESQGLG